jgi:DNA-binding Xre family transcriptional regulator
MAEKQKKKVPTLSRARIAELSAMANKIDREEGESIKNKARQHKARHDRIRQTVARLKAARVQKKLTLEQVSIITGIGKANLSRLENDDAPNPTIDTILRISEAVGYEILK